MVSDEPQMERESDARTIRRKVNPRFEIPD